MKLLRVLSIVMAIQLFVGSSFATFTLTLKRLDSSSNSVSVSVTSDMTIQQVKEELKKHDMHSSWRVANETEVLDDSKTLKSYGIEGTMDLYLLFPKDLAESSSSSSITRMPTADLFDITIKKNGREYKVYVSNQMTVAQVKQDLAKQDPEASDEGNLFYYEKELENERTLASYNFHKLGEYNLRMFQPVSSGRTIRAKRAPRAPMSSRRPPRALSFEDEAGAMKFKVTINNILGPLTPPIEVDSGTTIFKLKQLFSEAYDAKFKQKHSACQMQFTLGGRILENAKTLADYGIQEGSAISGDPHDRNQCKDLYITVLGSSIGMYVGKKSKIKECKLEIQRMFGVNADNLSFNGTKLDDDKSFEECGITGATQLTLQPSSSSSSSSSGCNSTFAADIECVNKTGEEEWTSSIGFTKHIEGIFNGMTVEQFKQLYCQAYESKSNDVLTPDRLTVILGREMLPDRHALNKDDFSNPNKKISIEISMPVIESKRWDDSEYSEPLFTRDAPSSSNTALKAGVVVILGTLIAAGVYKRKALAKWWNKRKKSGKKPKNDKNQASDEAGQEPEV